MADPKNTHETFAKDFIPSDTRRAVFLGNPMLDNLYAAMTAICGEVWSVRRRLNIVESLMDKHGAVTREMTETYQPTTEEVTQWNAQRDNFINLVFDPFLRPADVPYTSSLEPNKGKP